MAPYLVRIKYEKIRCWIRDNLERNTSWRQMRWFGYHAVPKAAEEVLEGTYEYTDNFDELTRDIM